MKNSEVKTNIEVSGVILAEKAIHRLNELQSHNNEQIASCREYIADAICFIGKNFDYALREDLNELQDLITNLSFIRDYFNDLRKP
jgi:hypothetical protein